MTAWLEALAQAALRLAPPVVNIPPCPACNCPAPSAWTPWIPLLGTVLTVAAAVLVASRIAISNERKKLEFARQEAARLRRSETAAELQVAASAFLAALRGSIGTLVYLEPGDVALERLNDPLTAHSMAESRRRLERTERRFQRARAQAQVHLSDAVDALAERVQKLTIDCYFALAVGIIYPEKPGDSELYATRSWARRMQKRAMKLAEVVRTTLRPIAQLADPPPALPTKKPKKEKKAKEAASDRQAQPTTQPNDNSDPSAPA